MKSIDEIRNDLASITMSQEASAQMQRQLSALMNEHNTDKQILIESLQGKIIEQRQFEMRYSMAMAELCPLDMLVLKDKYFNRMTNIQLASKYLYSESGIKYVIHRALLHLQRELNREVL